jgi:hypothetical protein
MAQVGEDPFVCRKHGEDTVVVCVHGLRGSRFATWGNTSRPVASRPANRPADSAFNACKRLATNVIAAAQMVTRRAACLASSPSSAVPGRVVWPHCLLPAVAVHRDVIAIG